MMLGYTAPTLLSTLHSGPYCTQKAANLSFSHRVHTDYAPGNAMNGLLKMYVTHTIVNCFICSRHVTGVRYFKENVQASHLLMS